MQRVGLLVLLLAVTRAYATTQASPELGISLRDGGSMWGRIPVSPALGRQREEDTVGRGQPGLQGETLPKQNIKHRM